MAWHVSLLAVSVTQMHPPDVVSAPLARRPFDTQNDKTPHSVPSAVLPIQL